MFNGGNNGVVPVIPFGNMNGYGNGMGGWGDGWWAIIILFALFGWGGNGFGFGGGGNTAEIDASLQRGFNNQTVISKLDGITNGICNLGYDQLAQMNGINTNIFTQSNALMAQLQQCCCNIEQAIMQMQFAMQQGFCTAEYNRAADTCTITTAIKDAVRDIQTNCDNNYRSLYNQQVAMQMDALKTENQNLRYRLEKCDDQNMLNDQTQRLETYLRPPANPAFIVPAPWYSGSFYNNGGCCNGNGFSFGF